MPDYGHAHRKLRKRWSRQVDRGEVACARCLAPIWPGQPWDLGHDDATGQTRGPEHRRCNRAAGGWKRWHPTPDAPTRWAL